MSLRTVIIVGAGQAGLQAAQSLRDGGFSGNIKLFGDEAHPPYQRPPLSKAYLKDATTGVILRGPDFFSDRAIALETSTSIRSIDRLARTVATASGASLPYDHLILATGAGARRLNMPGADLDGVLSLRGITDADRLREAARAGDPVVIIGAGFIGLEIAGTLQAYGCPVTIIEMAPQALGRAVSRPVSHALTRAAEVAGIVVKLATGLAGFDGDGNRLEGVRLADGTRLPARLAIVAAGAVPHDALGRDAGLAHGHGIPVDETLLSADPAISAIGDVALYRNAHAGEVMRVESVQNAVDQGRMVAGRLLGTASGPYAALPWFWSDQGRNKLQIVGIARPGDRTVIRGPVEGTDLVVGRFRNDRLVAVETINRPADHMVARRLIADGATVTPETFADMGTDLKALASAAAPAR